MTNKFKTWLPIFSGLALTALNSCSNPGYYVVCFFLLLILYIAIHNKNGIFSLDVSFPKKAYVILGSIGFFFGLIFLLRFVSFWNGTTISRLLASMLPFEEKTCIIILGSFFLLLSLPVLTLLLLQLFRSINKELNFIKQNVSWWSILPYVLFLVMMIGVILAKTNYNADEIYSFGLANHNDGMGLSIEDGVTYTPASLPYDDYMTVSENSRFNYENVWLNQEMDVHPPLYYVLLHTICSLFPNTFSRWYAGVINIAFALLTLYVMRKWLSIVLKKNYKLFFLISITFVLSAGILSAVTFFRMYIMAMFWNMLLVYLVSKEILSPSDWTFYAKLYPVIVCAALTHYYCIVFSVLLISMYGIICIINKRAKAILSLITIGFSTGISSYLLFPAMVTHMFLGYRGTEALDNLKGSASDYLTRIAQFFNMMNQDLFGYCLLLIVFFVVGIFIWKAFIKKENNDIGSDFKKLFLFIVIPVIIYFLFVSKSAAYISERYLVPIYPIVFCFVLAGLGITIQAVFPKQYWSILFTFSMAFMLIGWMTETWPNLYRSSSNLIDFSKHRSDLDCIYIYEDEQTASLPFSYLETKNYNSVTFIGENNLDSLSDDLFHKDAFVLTIIPNKLENLQKIKNKYPELNVSNEIGTFLFGTTYYLYH